MIIRLGLLDKDERYIKLLSGYFNEHSDMSFQIESYLFFDVDSFQKFQKSGAKLDILLASAEVLGDSGIVPEKTVLSYLTEDPSIQTWDGYPAMCKYQKTGSLLKKIHSLAAKVMAEGGNFSLGTQGGMIAFIGTAGGVGTTTAAMGCAERMVSVGRSVLYFSAQQNARPEYIFQAGASMSEVYYAYREWKSMGAKAGEGKLQLRLKSMISTDTESGVASFAGFNLPLDALDIKASEVAELLKVLSGLYDVVIIDLENRIDDVLIEILKIVNWTILVSDGSENANHCLQRFAGSISELNNSGSAIKGEVGLLYTRFGSASKHTTVDSYIRSLGDIPKIGNADQKEIVRNLKNSKAFALLEK